MNKSANLSLLLFSLLVVLSCTSLGKKTPTPQSVIPTHTEPPAAATTATATVQVTASVASSITATTTPSGCPPATLPQPGWLTFCNETFGFSVQYPPDGMLTEPQMNVARVDLSFVPGTNLQEKYLELVAQESSAACASPLASGYDTATLDPQNLVISGHNFLRQSGSDAGAGNRWEWISYTTGRTNLCVSLSFVLHSTNPMNYPTPPPEFDPAAEKAIIEQVVSTFRWLEP